MKISIKKICTIILLLLVVCTTWNNSAWAACKKGETQSCQLSNDCYPARSGKHYTTSAHGNDIGGDCVKKASAGGC